MALPPPPSQELTPRQRWEIKLSATAFTLLAIVPLSLLVYGIDSGRTTFAWIAGAVIAIELLLLAYLAIKPVKYKMPAQLQVPDVIDRLKQYEIPDVVYKIINRQDIPEALQMSCEPIHEHGFWPLTEDFIPIWTSNGTNCVAFEPSTGSYIAQHVEDGSDPPYRFKTFDRLSLWLLFSMCYSGEEQEDIREASMFLEFPYIDQLMESSSEEEFLNVIQLN